MNRRRLAAIVVAALVLGGGATAGVVHSVHESEQAASCAKGFHPVRPGEEEDEGEGFGEGEHKSEAEREREREREREGGDGDTVCLNNKVRHPESYEDLMRVNGGMIERLGLSNPAAYAKAIQQGAALAGSGIKGTAGTWTPIGDGHVTFNNPKYTNNAFGLAKSSGRISAYAFNTHSSAVYASVANGGVWKSLDTGKTWTSIGDNLPTQIVGGLGWTPSGGDNGTIIALTGDNAFGGWSYPGAGIYWSTDEGATWHKATGVPDGGMGFRVAVDPGHPEINYAATGAGLYRSTDSGRSWQDVALPTGACAGKSLTLPSCFLATVVTDVAVRGADKFGHTDGAVTAAVGWRAGQKQNTDGTVQAPENGIYTSETGLKGSFTKVTGGGFPDSLHTGRTALGAAYGPDQDHNYLYALVQDANVFNGGTGNDLLDLGTTVSSYFNGAYVSHDFGKTWTQIADLNDLINPASGSTLGQLAPLGFGPGVQSWYNLWIQPDPYSSDALGTGAPTRLDFGLEEIWENVDAGGITGVTGTPKPTFHVVAPYSFFGGACILVATSQACSTVTNLGTTTTHPDQHAALFAPGSAGGAATLLVGNDGGSYHATVPAAGPFVSTGFGGGDVAGFNTLLPYSVAVAKDGVVYSGLQDNGSIRIDPVTGEGNEVNGGDGTGALVDPDNSDDALYATPEAGFVVTHDGGVTSTDVAPSDITDAPFTTPIAFDDKAATSEITAGRQVFISPTKLADLTSSTWAKQFDLGTRLKPGVDGAVVDPDKTKLDSVNVATAVALNNGTSYVGFCGSCDPVKAKDQIFHAGIATNAGGTWHIATATGLPQRIITSVKIDPNNLNTVYVGLGTSTVRPYAGPGALGADGTDASGGYLYKSTDGGATFTDVSGNLPKVGVQSVQIANGQLLAGTTVGVFAAPDTNGTTWGELGSNLPKAPIWQIAVNPKNANEIYVANYGRGIWKYAFADPATTPPTTTPGTPPAGAVDSDGDGIPDSVETTTCANPHNPDTDGDGLTDGREYYGLAMNLKVRTAKGTKTVGLVRPNPCRADTDGDGISDGVEVQGYRINGKIVLKGHRTRVIGFVRSDPTKADTDVDGLGDNVERTGSANRRYHRRATSPVDWDTDRGGISDGREVRYRSDPGNVYSGPKNPRGR